MKTDQNTTNSQNTQDTDAELDNLLKEAKNINLEIDETNKETMKEMVNLNAQADETINRVEKIYSELDQIEKEAGDEMDKLILEEAVSLSEE